MRRWYTGGLVSLALTACVAPAQASLKASATLTPAQLGPNSYEYSLTLTNTGTTPIGTFWYSWIPGYDLLPHAPTSILSPAGWTGKDAPDFFGAASVQWVSPSSPLQPGQSLSGFKFDTADSPTAIGGTSFFAGLPVGQSYVYIGAPQTDPGFAFVTTTVTPEPASLAALALPTAFLLRRRRPCGFNLPCPWNGTRK